MKGLAIGPGIGYNPSTNCPVIFSEYPMKILFIKLSAIGDVVQTLPALEAIKNIYPDSAIDWVVEEAAADILRDHPLINRLLISRRKTWLRMMRKPSTFLRGFREAIGFFRELRSAHYDIAIDFQGLFKSGVLIGLAHAERKIGFDRTRELSYLFLNEKLPPYNIEKHALERYLDVARYLGAHDPSPHCSLPIAAEMEKIGTLTAELKRGREGIITINPVGRWKSKLWEEGKFAGLADRLVRERNSVVIFTGSVDDAATVERIRSQMQQQAVNWAGRTTLKELAALAALSDLFITTDTGPMHLAAASGARVVALFGPTAPWRTGPYGPGHIVIRTGIECSPCFQRDCEDARCMGEITVEEVMKQIQGKAPVPTVL